VRSLLFIRILTLHKSFIIIIINYYYYQSMHNYDIIINRSGLPVGVTKLTFVRYIYTHLTFHQQTLQQAEHLLTWLVLLGDRHPIIPKSNIIELELWSIFNNIRELYMWNYVYKQSTQYHNNNNYKLYLLWKQVFL